MSIVIYPDDDGDGNEEDDGLQTGRRGRRLEVMAAVAVMGTGAQR
jgi:hypothetical protein